jgi:hypothetical protein
VRWHLASVKSLCPLGQPEKALGHEPQIDPWLPHRITTTACQFQDPIGVVATNEDAVAETESPRAQHYTSVFYGQRGLDVANQTRASGTGRKVSLTCPLIEQAITRFEPQSGILSVIEMFRQRSLQMEFHRDLDLSRNRHTILRCRLKLTSADRGESGPARSIWLAGVTIQQ